VSPGPIQLGGWFNPIKQMVQSIQANGQIKYLNKIMENMIASTDKEWDSKSKGLQGPHNNGLISQHGSRGNL
jgi:hypothetical protein